MSNVYRVLMSDKVNGIQFNFAIKYKAANANVAGILAIKEWVNLPIISISRE